MADRDSGLSGTERSAILLMSLGEEYAANILKHMEPREVHKVGTAMSSLSKISSEQINEVLQEFVESLQGQNATDVGREEYVSKVLVQALGSEKASNMINRVLQGRNVKGLESLKWMDPVAIAELVTAEHPQIISIVLSQLDADLAASVLTSLDEETRTDVLMRVAKMEEVNPSALEELDHILASQFREMKSIKPPRVGGPRTVADILNYLGNKEENAITENIMQLDEELGQEIKDLMFVFDNLKDINDRGIQALLREVSTDQLVVALKGADDSLSEKIFNNMSKRAAELLKDDMETKGPVKLSEVQAAQKEVLMVAQRMAENGDIVIGGKGGEEYV
ncbi:MAG: flagellar motor switch protein FliG [Gammaproteobacteria bacterium]